MKNKLKPDWVPKWRKNMPDNWQHPKPTMPTEYSNYVRHQITKAQRLAAKENQKNAGNSQPTANNL